MTAYKIISIFIGILALLMSFGVGAFCLFRYYHVMFGISRSLAQFVKALSGVNPITY